MADVYDQLCQSYRGIDDFRAKLLGYLPLATGAGILLAVKEAPSLLQHFSPPIAVFGFLITLGLLCYEIYGIRKCAELIRTGKKIELDLKVQGQFVSRPHGVWGRINEPFAAGVIYPAVLASWTFVGFVRMGAKDAAQQFSYYGPPCVAWLISGAVFVGGFALILIYDGCLRRTFKEQCDGCRCQFEPGERAQTRITTIKTSRDYWLCPNCSESLIPWLQSRRSA
jgi:hypothetical protein